MKWTEIWKIFKLFRSLSLSDSWEILIAQSKKTNPGGMALVLFSYSNCCMFLNQLERNIHAYYSVLTHVFIKGRKKLVGFEDGVCVTWSKLCPLMAIVICFYLCWVRLHLHLLCIVIVRTAKIHMWNVMEEYCVPCSLSVVLSLWFSLSRSMSFGQCSIKLSCVWGENFKTLVTIMTSSDG